MLVKSVPSASHPMFRARSRHISSPTTLTQCAECLGKARHSGLPGGILGIVATGFVEADDRGQLSLQPADQQPRQMQSAAGAYWRTNGISTSASHQLCEESPSKDACPKLPATTKHPPRTTNAQIPRTCRLTESGGLGELSAKRTTFVSGVRLGPPPVAFLLLTFLWRDKEK